ncbi:hypothetical protein [Halorussus sp. AFM4]|uniref:hypothetical protein n=1 Tax=Halorussus sp. AFM4 TaxID=3421651 RepID=UPI003EB743AC
MDDDRTVDRRSFLRGASAAGLVGVSGIGSLRSAAGRGDGGRDDAGDDREPGAIGQQQGAVDYMQAVLPAGRILDADLVYRILVVGGPIQPHERPPPLCFPEGEEQWRARNALVIKPTETTGIFGAEDIGGINTSRAYLERPVEPGSVWRIAGGRYCDGHALVTIHELPPELSEYFSKEMIDTIDQFTENQTAGNATEDDDIFGNNTLGNETAGNETVGNESTGDATDVRE